MELFFGFGKEVIHRNVMFVRCLVASKCCLCGQAQVGSHPSSSSPLRDQHCRVDGVACAS